MECEVNEQANENPQNITQWAMDFSTCAGFREKLVLTGSISLNFFKPLFNQEGLIEIKISFSRAPWPR
jgi:hypothetical protein